MLRYLTSMWWRENRCPWVAPRSRSCNLVDGGWLGGSAQGASGLPVQTLGSLLAVVVAVMVVNVLLREQHQNRKSSAEDETGFVTKGKHSVGIKRQCSGAAGRAENCQEGSGRT